MVYSDVQYSFWSSYVIDTCIANKHSGVTDTSNLKFFDRAHVECVSGHPYTDHAEESEFNTNSSLPLNSMRHLCFPIFHLWRGMCNNIYMHDFPHRHILKVAKVLKHENLL